MTSKRTKGENIILGTFAVLCHLGGFALIFAGIAITPEHLPATWGNVLHPGVLTFIAGCIGLAEGTAFLCAMR